MQVASSILLSDSSADGYIGSCGSRFLQTNTNAVAIVIRYWDGAQVVPTGAWIAIFWVVFMGLSMLGVLAYERLNSYWQPLKSSVSSSSSSSASSSMWVGQEIWATSASATSETRTVQWKRY